MLVPRCLWVSCRLPRVVCLASARACWLCHRFLMLLLLLMTSTSTCWTGVLRTCWLWAWRAVCTCGVLIQARCVGLHAYYCPLRVADAVQCSVLVVQEAYATACHCTTATAWYRYEQRTSALVATPLLQVTKLCDLAPEDQVCSVAWSQRGTYLSVGTNTGEVQVSGTMSTLWPTCNGATRCVLCSRLFVSSGALLSGNLKTPEPLNHQR